MPLDGISKSLITTAENVKEGVKWLLFLVLLLNFLGREEGLVFMLMIRFMTLMLHLPMLRIVFPGNVSTMIEYGISIALFDLTENVFDWEENSPLRFAEIDQLDIIAQVEDCGYDSHNALMLL